MVINQFHAIGDLLFCEPIFRYYWKKNGVKPIVPVRDHLMWLSDAIESADFRPMSKFELDYDSMEINNPDYLPLRFANQILRGLDANDHSDFENCMLDKYLLVAFLESNNASIKYLEQFPLKEQMVRSAENTVRFNLSDLALPKWTDIKLKFDWSRGQHLSELHKVLFMNNRYTLINNYSQAGELDIKSSSGLLIHFMTEVPGYSVLDWCSMIVNAADFHSVSTSTFFAMQALCNELGSSEIPDLYIYPRPNEDGLRGVKNLIEEVGFNVIKME